jgi:hypothetical protein
MNLRYTRHYTRDEARALLPSVRAWLAKLRLLQPMLEQEERGVKRLLDQGRDLGGERVNDLMRTWLAARAVAREFEQRQLQIKNLHRGLVDFPAIVAGREVFLCWEEGEEDVEYWHDLDAGFAGRSPF